MHPQKNTVLDLHSYSLFRSTSYVLISFVVAWDNILEKVNNCPVSNYYNVNPVTNHGIAPRGPAFGGQVRIRLWGIGWTRDERRETRDNRRRTRGKGKKAKGKRQKEKVNPSSSASGETTRLRFTTPK